MAQFEYAADAVRNITSGINLGNSFDANGHYTGGDITKYETQWGEPPVSRELITLMKESGFNAVRVPVTYKHHFDENGTIDKAWLARVREVTDHILSLGLYCIINIHHDGGEGSWVLSSTAGFESKGELFGELWVQIAQYFEDCGERLLFEGINEPINEKREWLANDEDSIRGTYLFNQRFIDSVRATGGNNAQRNLIVMPYAGSGTQGRLDTFELPHDTVKGRLIVEVHNYDPQGFCWYKAIGQVLRDTWGTDEDHAQIEYFKGIMQQAMKRLDVPMIVGEYGSQDKKNTQERAKQARAFVSAMREIGVKCFWWECGAFSLIDRHENKVRFGEIVRAITQQCTIHD